MLSKHNERLSLLQSNLQFRHRADASAQSSKISEHSSSISGARRLSSCMKTANATTLNHNADVSAKASLPSMVIQISTCAVNKSLLQVYGYAAGENNKLQTGNEYRMNFHIDINV